MVGHLAWQRSLKGSASPNIWLFLAFLPSSNHLSLNSFPQSSMPSSSTTLVSSVRPKTTQYRFEKQSTTNLLTSASLRHYGIFRWSKPVFCLCQRLHGQNIYCLPENNIRFRYNIIFSLPLSSFSTSHSLTVQYSLSRWRCKSSPFFLRQILRSRSNSNTTPQTMPVGPTTNYNQHRQSVSFFWHLSRSIQAFCHQALAEEIHPSSPNSLNDWSRHNSQNTWIPTLFSTHQSAFMKHHST